MEAEFFYPFEPRSPEALIYQFCRTHCCRTSYESCAPGSNVDMITQESFTLPFDTFLRSVSKFNPVRDRYLDDGPHVYTRQFMEEYLPDDRRKAEILDVIAETMQTSTINAMGVITEFLEFASKEVVSQAIAGELPRSRKWERPEERAARRKGYWKSIQEIERSFNAIVAIHNMAREKHEISRIVVSQVGNKCCGNMILLIG